MENLTGTEKHFAFQETSSIPQQNKNQPDSEAAYQFTWLLDDPCVFFSATILPRFSVQL